MSNAPHQQIGARASMQYNPMPDNVDELREWIEQIMQPWAGVNGGIFAIRGCALEIALAIQARPSTDAIQSAAARDVLAERQRQISAEGWTPEHDDKYTHGDMASAAACYASQGRYHYPVPGKPGPIWPWAAEWWKPSGYRRNLVKAGALIIAEIERLDRAAARAPSAQEGA